MHHADAPPALLTDLYQVTMAYAAWQAGRAESRASFSLYYRSAPFGGGYTVACGLEACRAFLANWAVTRDECDYLRSLTTADGGPLFSPDFLDWLGALRLKVDVDMVPEGRVVFPNEPLIRVTGPLAQAMLIETTLENLTGFPTLVATKAARICGAAEGDDVIEMGLRRSQGPDGGVTASRAAYVGGCAATSNLVAGERYGIPVRGTHAHAWVMAYDRELDAFDAFARAHPRNSILLVDTYDTLDGVRNAITVAERMRARGDRLLGIRLDSGDLAYLSTEARRLLDAAGFPDVQIVASNDLDEHLIDSLKRQGARIDVWGIGTKLVTAADSPSLGVVYKLTAIEDAAGEWAPRIKVSEQASKTTTPGVLQVRRYRVNGEFAGDMLYDETAPPVGVGAMMVDPTDLTRRKRFAADAEFEELLRPALRAGALVGPLTSAREALDAARARCASDLASFHAGVKRLVNPHQYPVGLERRLYDRRTALVLAARKLESPEPPPAGWDVAAD